MKNTSKMSRRQFLSDCGRLSFTAVAISSLPMAGMLSGCMPDDQIYRIQYRNWSDGIVVDDMLAVKPKDQESLLQVANWAYENGYAVRAIGFMHTWCPITIAKTASGSDKIVLVDMTDIKGLSMDEQTPDYGIVRVAAGSTLESMHEYLADQTSVCPSGYGFSNFPAPGELTVGGALAIGCHGTSVPYSGSDEPENLFGSLSNKILSVKFLAWNAADRKYELKTITRDDPEIAAFMVHLGRTIITEFTLQASKGFNLRCISVVDQNINDICAPNQDDNYWTISNILDRDGRCEIIWFPFTEKPWLKVWQRADVKPSGSRATTKPYNYEFSDSFPRQFSDLFRNFLRKNPKKVAGFGQFQYTSTKLALLGGFNTQSLDTELQSEGLNEPEMIEYMSELPEINIGSADIWGPAWHVGLYVRPTTLRMHANGYAVRIPRSDVQSFMHQFKEFYAGLLDSYKAREEYPASGPLEVRFNGLDYEDDIVTPNAKRPAISALTPSSSDSKDYIGVWLDVLSFVDTVNNWEMYNELEQWLLANYGNVTRGEWSKGWGYTDEGPWKNDAYLANLPNSFAGTQTDYQFVIDTLDKYDPNRLFAAPIHDKIFPRS